MMNYGDAGLFPALHGGVVTERHAQICADLGHSVHTVDGQRAETCPRCGVVLDVPPAQQFKICRECHGWGSVEIRLADGMRYTEDCRPCAGTGEEL